MSHIRARSTRSRVGAMHADWLSLVEPSGQFLTIPTLKRAFPNGLPTIDVEQRREVREWAASLDHDNSAEATAWLEYLLGDLLGWGSRLLSGPAIPDHLSHTVAEHHTTLRPEYVLVDKNKKPRVLVERYPTSTRLDARLPGDPWAATPIERTATLCRALGVPVGIVTDSRYLVLVYAPMSAVGGHATWDTALFAEGAESTLLEALVAVLAAQRFFAVGAGDRLEELLEESASAQAELTNTLGLQVRRAVELLVAAISKSNVEAEGRYLRGVPPHRVYEAAATTVMRLVFLLYAEERQLLPLGEELYDDNYAVSTLGQLLSEESDRTGDEPLELRSAAWHRLLATFRAVFAGVSHDRLRMPPYGGSLFDPDRFPFLEGRAPGQTWTGDPSHPVPVDDLTVREILDALQWISTTEGGVTEARRLSFRALDVEQIGHVYEGTLDHSALFADEVIVGLVGKPGNEPEVALAELESHLGNDLEDFLLETTGKTKRQISVLLEKSLDDETQRRIRTAVDNDEALVQRLTPFAHLLRDDLRGLPTVFTPGTVYVTETSHRRDTGTEYTPRELADEIVLHALEPLVYEPGPAQGAERSDWRLKSSAEILKLRVCDPAVGSGAILVAACRYLAERLVEAWIAEGSVPDGYAPDPNVIADGDEVTVLARRAVADQCIYGVDRDPMAVEMAKLSLWLTTMSRERPFTFIDHAIRAGDSLLGLTSLDQITAFHMDPDRGRKLHKDLFVDLQASLKPLVEEVLELRRDITALPVVTVRDVDLKAAMNAHTEQLLETATAIADAVVGAALCSGGKARQLDDLLLVIRPKVVSAVRDPIALGELRSLANEMLNRGRPSGTPDRHPLHWALAFPEIVQSGGFDALVGNPPFQGGTLISANSGSDWLAVLSALYADGKASRTDLCVYFFRRAAEIAPQGGFGFIATQAIASGASRTHGLQALQDRGWRIPYAVSRRAWPASANVYVALVWCRRFWDGSYILNSSAVSAIDPGLAAARSITERPRTLASNSGLALEGCKPNGKAFLLSPQEAGRLLDENPFESEVVRPYLTGSDLNSSPTMSASRWIIDFRDWSATRAAAYPGAWRIAESRIRAERSGAKPKLRENFWQYEHPGMELRNRLSDRSVAVVIAATSSTMAFARVPTRQVFSNSLVILAVDGEQFAVLSSQIHKIWTLRFTTYFKSDPRYHAPSAFETFPLPERVDSLSALGESIEKARHAVMQARWIGLTKTYNQVNDPDCTDADVQVLRNAHIALDHAVLSAYGWTHIIPDHGFHNTAQGIRFAMSPRACDDVLDCLLELNQARFANEERAGLRSNPTTAQSNTRKVTKNTPYSDSNPPPSLF